MDAPVPQNITLEQGAGQLTLEYGDGQTYTLSCEYLRVYSPSAEVQGHGPGQRVLQTGKRSVTITNIVPVGNYAVALHFSDGHATGIYSWKTLHRLATRQNEYWQRYLDELAAANASRD
ncbi:MAG: DUF971 domain-containing protein [Pseudomonadota bacterium]